MYARVEPADDRRLLDALADVDLIRRSKLGDDEALGVLLERHRDALYRFCLHLTGNPDDADDICQETLARVITRVDTLQSSAAFRTWLFRIARNLSVDSFRSQKRTCPLPDEEITPLPSPEDGPQEHAEVREEHQTVAEAMTKLADSHQRVLLLREVEGLSYADISQEMNVSKSAVETLLFRARRRLREEFSKSYVRVPGFAAVSVIKNLALRVSGPVVSGAPLAAKIAVTSVVVGGAVATAPHLLPLPKAHLVPPPAAGYVLDSAHQMRHLASSGLSIQRTSIEASGSTPSQKTVAPASGHTTTALALASTRSSNAVSSPKENLTAAALSAARHQHHPIATSIVSPPVNTGTVAPNVGPRSGTASHASVHVQAPPVPVIHRYFVAAGSMGTSGTRGTPARHVAAAASDAGSRPRAALYVGSRPARAVNPSSSTAESKPSPPVASKPAPPSHPAPAPGTAAPGNGTTQRAPGSTAGARGGYYPPVSTSQPGASNAQAPGSPSQTGSGRGYTPPGARQPSPPAGSGAQTPPGTTGTSNGSGSGNGAPSGGSTGVVVSAGDGASALGGSVPGKLPVPAPRGPVQP